MARGDMRGPSGFNRLLRVRGGSIVAAARMRAVTLKKISFVRRRRAAQPTAG